MSNSVVKQSWCALAVYCCLVAWAAADSWQPSNTVEIVAGSSAGGALDRTARQIQMSIQADKLVSQPVIVVDKPGAGSAIAWDYVDRHPGDGHYLSIAIPGLISNRMVGLSPLSYQDFTPLAILSSEYVLFAVPSSSSIKSGSDLIATMKADPGRLNVGVATALGGANHVAVCEAMKAANVDIKRIHFVVYRSSAEAVTALLGNHIDLVAASASNVLPALDTGKVRAVATTAPKRMRSPLQHIPTWKEQGVDVTFASWRGVIGPRNMTPAQISFWDGVLRHVAESTAWKKSLTANLEEETYFDSVQTRSFLAREDTTLTAVLSELGLTK